MLILYYISIHVNSLTPFIEITHKVAHRWKIISIILPGFSENKLKLAKARNEVVLGIA